MTAETHTDRSVEFAFQAIARAIDQVIDRAGPERTELFLARLALIMSDQIGARAAIEDCIERALAGLPGNGDGNGGG